MNNILPQNRYWKNILIKTDIEIDCIGLTHLSNIYWSNGLTMIKIIV